MIVLITPTGGRSRQFNLCCNWMRKQTYTGKVLWIIVDDCIPRTTLNIEPFPKNWTIITKYPSPIWRNGDNTQSRNLKVGIDIIKSIPKKQVEGIFIIEDDDYYSPVYLEKMVVKLEGFTIAGEIYTMYYHIGEKKYRGDANVYHTSLFQTAFKTEAIPAFELSYGNKFIDIEFFKHVTNVNLFPREDLAIGIKGMNGRGGIGGGHRRTMYKGLPDYNLAKLKEFIGEDYKYYK